MCHGGGTGAEPGATGRKEGRLQLAFPCPLGASQVPDGWEEAMWTWWREKGAALATILFWLAPHKLNEDLTLPSGRAAQRGFGADRLWDRGLSVHHFPESSATLVSDCFMAKSTLLKHLAQ